MKLDHIAIVTKDFDRLVDWYRQNLGFELAREEWKLDDLLPDKRIAYLDKDEVRLEIIGDGAMAHEAVLGANIVEEYMIPGYRHYCIRVDDVESLMNDLASKGVSIAFPASTFDFLNVKAGIVTDCDGNTLEFMEHLS